jgi:TolB-like protein
VRRLLAVVLVALLGLPLLAATPETFSIKPRAVVYPFTSTSSGSSVDREASSRLATIIAQQMANTGLVTVIPPQPATERKDYLSAARTQNADYYIAGFISPLGSGVSLVEQVVSTATGIVIFSQSTQLTTYQEAAAQGDDIAQFIVRHANRAFASIGTPPPQASPTPAPSSGPEANLGKLFGRKKKATPAPKPAATTTPVASATAPAAALVNVPSPGPRPLPTPSPKPAEVAVAPAAAGAAHYAVTTVDGGVEASLRELAVQRIAARTNAEHAASVVAACGAQPIRAVLSGILAVKPDPQFGSYSATFELDATDCSGKVVWRESFTRDAGGAQGMQLATERAVDAAVGAYLNPPKPRRR